jgi:uridine kinase
VNTERPESAGLDSATPGLGTEPEPERRPLVVGLAGGSGSGKSTIVRNLVRRLGPDRVSLIHHDAYYRDYAHLSEEDRSRINFDHPNALETELLEAHLEALLRGETVHVPVYDFTTHTRSPEVLVTPSREVILVDGILVLAEPSLRRRMDIRIYVDTDADLRFIRRMDRDVRERGRSIASVVGQYLTSVRPMHLEFVEPSRRWADIILPEGGENHVAIDLLVAKLADVLVQRGVLAGRGP